MDSSKMIHRMSEYGSKKSALQTSSWKIYKRLVKYVVPHKVYMFYAVCAICIVALLNFVIPQATRIVIDIVIPEADYSLLTWIAIGIVVFALLLGFFNFIGTYMMSVVGQRTIFDIRNKVYRHLQDLSISFFENRRTGELMSRVTNDVNALQQLITSGVVEIFKDVLIFVVILGYLFYADWQLALFVLLTFPIMIWVTRKFSVKIRGAFREVQLHAANVNDHLQDTLSSMKLIKSFSNEEYETDRFEQRNEKNMNANITAVRYAASFAPIIELLNYLGLAVIIVFGSWRAITGALTTGEFVLFLMYLRMIQQPIRRFTRVINVVQQAAAASERIFEIMDAQVEVSEKEDAVDLKPGQGHVRFDSVDFSYNESEEVLHNFTLEIKPGETVALVGPSGAGKSTVAQLIPRFYDPQHGTIYYDGYNIKDVTVKSLRNQVGTVSQEILLLNGSIRDNIAYSKPEATDEEIMEAAKKANAHEFIAHLPKGYDSQIGERGVKLSGGQRQRVSIARALLMDPRFLILDEATSALDTESEHLIQDALAILLKDRSCLVIAHRLSTIKTADRIVVIEHGKIVEEGTHDELLQNSGRYAGLYEMQFQVTG